MNRISDDGVFLAVRFHDWYVSLSLLACVDCSSLSVSDDVPVPVDFIFAADGFSEAGLSVSVDIELNRDFDVVSRISLVLFLVLV